MGIQPVLVSYNTFNLFYKPDEFTEGLGLGLSLCRKAINQMGGKIRIDEAYTNGTRIIITLPLDA